MPDATITQMVRKLLSRRTAVATQVFEIVLTLGMVASAGYLEDHLKAKAGGVVFVSAAVGMLGGLVLMLLILRLELTISGRVPKVETKQ